MQLAACWGNTVVGPEEIPSLRRSFSRGHWSSPKHLAARHRSKSSLLEPTGGCGTEFVLI